MFKLHLNTLCIAALSVGSASAGLIAHYDFTDGNLTDNEVGATYTLTQVTTGTGIPINADGSAAFGGSTATGYLETPAFGTTGVPLFTVSFWWKTSTLAQGNFQGLFTNDDGAASFSWQLDNSGADMRFISQGNTALTYPESNLSVDTWYHTVIRKNTAGANYTQVFITEEGAVSPTLVMNQNANPGGLNEFRLGTNRNTDSLFAMDMANVKIYNDNTENLTDLLNEGPQLVPEPSSSALLALGGLSLVFRRRKG